jgi:uncharacterized membrane protein
MTHWSITPVGGPWLVALVALVLSLLLAVAPSGRPLPRMRRMWLLALRALTLLLLLLIMLRPSRVMTETRRLPGSLVLLIDSSRSMQVADSLDNQPRWTVLRELLEQAHEPLAQLAKIWDLRFYRFDEKVAPVTWKDGRLDLPDLPDGDQSALGSAMEEILELESGQRIAALLLLSDGAQRALAPRDLAAQTATHLLADENIPLYTFALGKPALGVQTDLRIGDLLVPDVVFSEAPLQVQAMVGLDGYSNQTFRVQLLWEQSDGSMQVVDTRELLASSNQVPISFQYTPEQPGEYKVTVRVESPAGELVTTNNQQSTFVSVLKGGIRVLQLVGASRIGGGPGIEPSFVRRALAAHADIQVHYQLLNYRQPRLNYRDRLRTGKYDVLMLSDLDASALSKPSWQTMADQVAAGAGFIMTGGLHSFGPGGYRNTPLERVLPFELGRAERQNFGDSPRTDMHLPGPLKMLPAISSLGVHPILQVQDGLPQTLAAWQELPALIGANRFPPNRLRGNAQVIAQSDRSPAAPLAITGAWGNGRTLALAIDSTWRWQMNGHGPLMRRFWRQVILWLAKKDDLQNQHVWIRLDQRRYQRGSRVRFTLGGPDQGSASERPFQVEIVRPDGSRQALQPTRLPHSALGTNAWSGSTAETRQPGDYQVIVTAGEQKPDDKSQPLDSKNASLDTATVRFTVPNQDMELDQPAAEPTLLASLARQTPGGRGLAPEEFSALLKQLPSRQEDFEEQIVTQVTLWDRWPILLTLIGLLSIEWWLRKRWGLV